MEIKIPESYYDKNRFYHNEKHILKMIKYLDLKFKAKLTGREYDILKCAIVFHDAVYIPKNSNNEEESFKLFLDSVYSSNFSNEEIKTIENLIMVTKTLKPRTELEKIMLFLDWSIFTEDEKALYEYNYGIFKEYQEFNTKDFFKGRKKFFAEADIIILEAIKDSEYISFTDEKSIYEGLKQARLLFETFKPKIGVYAGSFNPFHIGHMDILEKAEKIFDKVILVRAKNPDKNNELYKMPDTGREQVEITENIFIKDIFDNIKSNNEESMTLIRGIRTGSDLISEQAYQQTIKELGFDYNIIHILCEPQHQHISSTMIRGALKVTDNAKKYLISTDVINKI